MFKTAEKEISMNKVFEIEFQKHEPYRIEWLSKQKQLSDYKISVNYIDYYDENSHEDIELILTKKDIRIDIRNMGDNIYDIIISGTIEIDVSIDDLLEKLKLVDYCVNYGLDFIDDESEYAEEDVHYRFIQNYSKYLIPIEE